MFSVEVPVAPASTAKRVPERAASATPLGSFNGLRVLAIDNDPAILDGMNTLLSGWGCAVQVASNGEEAEKCARDPDHRPAVIIADYHLDEGDGLAVIGAGMGIGRIGGSAVESIARQPEMAGKIFVNMILTAALVEGVALFAVVVGLISFPKGT